MKKLFIDDERYPPNTRWYHFISWPFTGRLNGWVVRRTYDSTIAWLNAQASGPAYVSFDNDIQDPQDRQGYHIAQWMVERDMDMEGKYLPDVFEFCVHSQNSVRAHGNTSISGYLNDYLEKKYGNFFEWSKS